MGKISQMMGRKSTVREAVERGQSTWREIFGRTDKEKPKPVSRRIPGGSYGRSMVAEPAAFRRLLQAMRSMAPGGWSDDRWEQTKHFVSIAYVGIHRICQQLSMAEFQVFKKDANHPDGKRPIKKDTDPEAYKLVELLEKPNNQDSFGKMLYRWGQQKYLTGTALTWMVPNELGVPMELYVIPTAIAIPQPAINPDYPDGYYRIQPVYPYGPFSSYPTPSTAVGAPIPAQWMIRSQYPHPLLRYDGYAPLTALRNELDCVEMINRSRHYKMRRSINPSAVLQTDEMEGAEPLPAAEIERIVAEFENEIQGPENHGRLFISPPGSRLEEFGLKPSELGWENSWEQLTSFCLGGGFGITKQAAGMIEDASYSTLFATLKQLYMITLEPETADISQELTRALAPFFGDDLIVEVRCKPINDHEINMVKISWGIQAKCITKNQVLKLLDLPVTKEKWGEEIAGTESGGAGGLAGMLGALGGGGKAGAGGPPPPPPGPPQGQEQPQQQVPLEEEIMEEQGGQDEEGERGRPGPGPLGRGSLGPRKQLMSYLRKKYGGSSRPGRNGVHKREKVLR